MDCPGTTLTAQPTLDTGQGHLYEGVLRLQGTVVEVDTAAASSARSLASWNGTRWQSGISLGQPGNRYRLSRCQMPPLKSERPLLNGNPVRNHTSEE